MVQGFGFSMKIRGFTRHQCAFPLQAHSNRSVSFTASRRQNRWSGVVRGLCYNCNESFVRGHQCKGLFYLESSDYIDDGGMVANGETTDTPATDVNAMANALVVSLHALTGIQVENSMAIHVMIQGECFLALLDTGSTHNFLQGATMRRLGFAASGGNHLRVTVTNGDRLRYVGIYRDVEVSITGEPHTITCISIDLGCLDFILGVDFLRTLGPATWDFDARTLTFQHGARRVLWQAAPSLLQPTSTQPTAAAVAADSGRPMLERLLQQHAAVFDEPQGLPPARPYDHRIHLLPGTAPIVVRSYRYPQLQKDELERQCAIMLA
jgi:hypothetical protein